MKDLFGIIYIRVLKKIGMKMKIGKKKLNQISNGRASIVSIRLSVGDKDSNLHLNPNGKFIGIDTIQKYILGQSPYYNGNILRSNLMHHTLPNLLKDKKSQKITRKNCRTNSC